MVTSSVHFLCVSPGMLMRCQSEITQITILCFLWAGPDWLWGRAASINTLLAVLLRLHHSSEIFGDPPLSHNLSSFDNLDSERSTVTDVPVQS